MNVFVRTFEKKLVCLIFLIHKGEKSMRVFELRGTSLINILDLPLTPLWAINQTICSFSFSTAYFEQKEAKNFNPHLC